MKDFKEIVIDNVIRGRYYINKKSEIFDKKFNRFITGHNNTGYIRVTLTCDDSKQKSYYKHVLVMCIYNGDFRKSKTVNHEDGDKTNNDLSNLKWMTHRENMKHAILYGLITNKKSLDEKLVHKICSMLATGISRVDVSKKLNVNIKTIEGITSGYNWKDISCNYNLPKRNSIYMKLNEDMVHDICKRIKSGYKNSYISNQLKINPTTINSIRRKDSWKHISKSYF